MVVFDAVRDEISLITPVRPQSGVSAKAAYEGALARLERAMWALERPLPFDERHDPRRLDADTPRSNTSEAEFLAMVERVEGVHPRRRHLPGRAVAALRGRFPAAGLRALPLAPARQPGAVPVLPRLRGFPDRLLEPGDPGAGARRHGHHPPDRRHAAARRDRDGGQAPRRRAPRRPEGARRAPDAARPRPQRRRPRRRRSAASG